MNWMGAGAITDVSWQEFWGNPENRETWYVMFPGVLDLLTHTSGNQWGERMFAKAARVITKLSKNLDVELKLCLHVNAKTFQLPGYISERMIPPSGDEEFWKGPVDTREW